MLDSRHGLSDGICESKLLTFTFLSGWHCLRSPVDLSVGIWPLEALPPHVLFLSELADLVDGGDFFVSDWVSVLHSA